MAEQALSTYYIRHTDIMDIDEEARSELCDTNSIAVHFPFDVNGNRVGNSSLDPNDYHPKYGKYAVELLNELAEQGGYVCAEYAWSSDCLVGKVSAGTKPFSRVVGVRKGLQTAEGPTTTLKCLQLEEGEYNWIPPTRQPSLLVGRPRQGTIRRWPSAGDRVGRMLGRSELQLSLDTLFEAQQEVLCAEFLRLPIAETVGLPRLAHELLPVGRTLRDLDVYGLATDGRPIFAQVTYAQADTQIAQNKLEVLKKYATEETHTILFCRSDTNRRIDGVHVVSMEKVFDRFQQSDFGTKWLELALS